MISFTQAKSYTFDFLRPLAARRTWVFWGYVCVFATLELVAVLIDPEISMLLYFLCLMALVLHASISIDGASRDLALTLCLVPLTRILTWSFPIRRFPQLSWYPFLGALLLVACWFVVRQVKLSRSELRLQSSNLVIQFLLAGAGPALGLLASNWLAPAPLLTSFSRDTFLIAAVILIVSTGFVEEFIYRGVIQAATLRVFRHTSGLFYSSIVCTTLYIGYGSPGFALFVLAVSLLFAYCVYWTGSILGVSLAHGLLNVVLLLVVPYLLRNPNDELSNMLLIASWSGVIMAAVAFVLIVIRGRHGT